MTASPIRVLYVLPGLDVGGAERTLLDLLIRIDRNFVDPIVCSLFPGGAMRDEFVASGIPVVELQAGRGIRQLLGVGLLPLLLRLRPRIVHSRLILANMVGRLGRMTGAYVLSEELGTEDDRPLRATMMNRATIGLSHLIATNASEVAERVHRRDGVPWSRIRIVRNGVDIMRFSPPVAAGATDFDVISVCRLEPIKGLLDFIDAAARIVTAHPSFRAALVGDGSQRVVLEEAVRARQLEQNILLAGPQKDIPEWLRRSSLFVLPSYQEGLPNGVMEAMACGLPVVATAVGGVPELVVDNTTGRLVGPGEPNALGAAILGYLNSPEQRASHGRAARARALEQFRMEVTVRGYEQLYRELYFGSCQSRREPIHGAVMGRRRP